MKYGNADQMLFGDEEVVEQQEEVAEEKKEGMLKSNFKMFILQAKK